MLPDGLSRQDDEGPDPYDDPSTSDLPYRYNPRTAKFVAGVANEGLNATGVENLQTSEYELWQWREKMRG